MDWETLMTRPAAYIHPARLEVCFGGTVTAAACARLAAAARLQERLSAVIVAFYRLAAPVGPDAAMPADRRVAVLVPAATQELVRRAGAVYFANAIASAVRADDVRRLRARLGEALYAFAVTNRDLSGPARELVGGDGTAALEEHGLRCLSAWCRSQPEAIAARVRLKMPPAAASDRLEAAVIDTGAAIVRRAAG